jgi:hypothetical protein
MFVQPRRWRVPGPDISPARKPASPPSKTISGLSASNVAELTTKR